MNKPYLNRPPITEPVNFYGRGREIRFIYSRLAKAHPPCVSIVGEPKIGKSSLLNFVAHPRNITQYLKNGDSYLFVPVNLQDGPDFHPESFFRQLKTGIHKAMGGLPTLDGNRQGRSSDSYNDCRLILEKLGEQAIKTIILLDDFEMIGRHEAFGVSFFSYLRSFATSGPVAYITTSCEDLVQISPYEDVRGSPFFNIFTHIRLGNLPDSEAIELIQKLSANAGMALGEAETRCILDLAGTHPLFLYIACDKMCDKKRRTLQLTSADYEAVESAFFDEAERHFDDIWQRTSHMEQEVLLQLVQQTSIKPGKRYLLDTLRQKGYVLCRNENDEPFSVGFEEYVWQKLPPPQPHRPLSRRRRRHSSTSSQESVLRRFKNLFRMI